MSDRIESLDLRPQLAIDMEREERRLAAVSRGLDALWPWPQFPERVEAFILAGEFAQQPKRTLDKILVEIVGNVAEFNRQMARTQAILNSTWLADEWRAALMHPRLRPLSQWRWCRICFWLGYLVAYVACVYLLVWWLI